LALDAADRQHQRLGLGLLRRIAQLYVGQRRPLSPGRRGDQRQSDQRAPHFAARHAATMPSTSSARMSPTCCITIRPRPSIRNVSGPPDEPNAICTLLALSSPIRWYGSPNVFRKSRIASGVSLTATASIGTPIALSFISCGASALHGRHQLANTLSKRG